MTSFNFRDLCGNPDLEQAEIDATNRDDAMIPFAGGIPDDVAAEMDAAFGYGLPLSESEMEAQAAEHDADCRRNDEAALLAEWPAVLKMSDTKLISIVGYAPANPDGIDELTAACAVELAARLDGTRPSIQ
jgi:hypothetical protein